MKIGNVILILFILYLLFVIGAWAYNTFNRTRLKKLQLRLDDIVNRERQFEVEKKNWEERVKKEQFISDQKFQIEYNELEKKKNDWHQKAEQERLNWENRVQSDKEAITQLAEEKSRGFPWLAKAYADYFSLRDNKVADYLENKSHPAQKAADHVREMAIKRHAAEKLYRVLQYQIEYYETLFPWLSDFKEDGLDELITQIIEGKDVEQQEDSEDDPVKLWLTRAEYDKLDRIEKYELALHRYWNRKKTQWEIGRDYERFIGFQYEQKGSKVYYHGIIEGFSDLGRDLISRSTNGMIHIVQCKYWSRNKLIHEKHVFQLYGSLIAYKIDNPFEIASGVLITSTELSQRARKFADELGIEYLENYPLQSYPCIKCNISDRGKIYHLPFDQQYDRTLIIEEKNERYVSSVREAEELGFRRAYRWRGNRE
jgi:hypothetical protein